MKAVQIKNYSKEINTILSDIPKPRISDSEVLIQVKAAAVNPVELLILTGSVKLIQDYPMPLTLGNECSGIVEHVGSKVERFKKRDRVYTRLPIGKIGAFAEYVAVEQDAVAKMPEGYDFNTAAAIPLTLVFFLWIRPMMHCSLWLRVGSTAKLSFSKEDKALPESLHYMIFWRVAE